MRVQGHRATQRRGLITRGFFGLLEVLLVGSIAQAAGGKVIRISEEPR